MKDKKKWQKQFDEKFKRVDNRGFYRLPDYPDVEIIDEVKQFISNLLTETRKEVVEEVLKFCLYSTKGHCVACEERLKEININ